MSFFRRLRSRKSARKHKQRNRQQRRLEFVNNIARTLHHEPLEERRLLAVDLSLTGSPLAEDGGVATFTATTDLAANHGGITVD
ncbi:MAG: hypothetical protein VB862_03945, partial [Pirellulaceae bacterium]